jgi:hypothetical protein
VAGAWLDSTPLLVISGQVKRADRMYRPDGTPLGVRQRGSQEVDIEWVYDLYGHDVNPLGNPAGIERLKNLVVSNGVCIRSVCADYFMDRPLLRCGGKELDERMQELARILRNGSAVGVNRIVIPFVDASAIRSNEDIVVVQDTLKAAIPFAEETGIEIHLETSLGPIDFAKLLDSTICVVDRQLQVRDRGQLLDVELKAAVAVCSGRKVCSGSANEVFLLAYRARKGRRVFHTAGERSHRSRHGP